MFASAEFIGISPVYQDVVTGGWSTGGGQGDQVHLVGRFEVPVIDHKCTEINIIVFRGRSVDNETSEYPHPILCGIMAVVPGSAILCELKIICLGLARRQRA